jgi:hypothetical protein
MSRSPKKPPIGSMPMSEWLTLMLAEVERKDAEASAAADERKHRAAPEDHRRKRLGQVT